MSLTPRLRNYISVSAVSFCHLFAWSSAMSFFAIWLGQSLDIGSSKVGILYSCNAVAALCLQPLFGYISDKIGLKKTLIFAILGVVVLLGPFFIYVYGPLLVSNFMLGAILGGLYLGFVFNAGYGAIDSYLDKVSRKYGFEYGRSRMWGSIGWAVATYTTGIFMNVNPNLAFLAASCSAIVAICFLAFAKIEMSAEETKKAASVKITDCLSLVHNRDFVFMIFFMIGVGCLYDVYDQQFGVYFVSQFPTQEEGNHWFGQLGAIQTGFEGLFLFIAPWIANKLGAKWTLILAGTIMAVRIIGSSFEWGPLWIGCMKCIHSFEKPLFLVAQFKYIAATFDNKLCSSIFLACLFTSSICATVFSPLFGYCYETFGFSASYFAIGCFALACTVISAKILKNDKPKHLPPSGIAV